MSDHFWIEWWWPFLKLAIAIGVWLVFVGVAWLLFRIGVLK